MHGDYMYEKGDYQEALNHYLKTIGYIEVSYVNRKFLQAQHMDYLIKYLKALHDKGAQDKHHTSQLLNCYVKKKDVEALQDFVEQKGQVDKELFDTETAIQVCRDLGKVDLALSLASKDVRYTELHIKILMESDKAKALTHIQKSLSLELKAKWFKEFGQQLVKSDNYEQGKLCLEFCKNMVALSLVKDRKDMAEHDRLKKYFALESLDMLLQDSVSSRVNFPRVEEFIGLFYSTSDELLTDFLEYLQKIQSRLSPPDQQVVLRRLIEVYLTQYESLYKGSYQSRRETSAHDDAKLDPSKNKIMDLLKKNYHFDQSNQLMVQHYNQLMVLFKMHNFEKGIIYLLKKTGKSHELLQYYMSNPIPKNKEKMLKVCQQRQEGDLYIQTFKFLLTSYCTAERDQESHHRLIEEAMKQLVHLNDPSPLMLLNIIQKVYEEKKPIKRRLVFKDVKTYFKKKTEDVLKSIESNRSTVEEKKKDQEESYTKYYDLRTKGKTFQASQCSTCKHKLRNPSVYFYCDHSYEKVCLMHDYEKMCDQQVCMDNYHTVTQRKEAIDNTNYSKVTIYG